MLCRPYAAPLSPEPFRATVVSNSKPSPTFLASRLMWRWSSPSAAVLPRRVQLKAEASALPPQAAVSANAPWSARGAAQRGESSKKQNLGSPPSEVLQGSGGSSCCGALRSAQAGAAETLLHAWSGSWVPALKPFVAVLCRDLDRLRYSM